MGVRSSYGPVMTKNGLDWRHTRYRNSKPQYFVYQICGWLLGASFGSPQAKSYKFEGGRLIIYNEAGEEVLNDTIGNLKARLRRTKWPNYPWN